MAARRITPLSEAVDRKLYIIGMTRREFAMSLHIGYNYLSLLLTGYYTPTIEMTNKMAEILETNPRELRELVLAKAI